MVSRRLQRKLRNLHRLVAKTTPARLAEAQAERYLRLLRIERMSHDETKRKLDEALTQLNEVNDGKP